MAHSSSNHFSLRFVCFRLQVIPPIQNEKNCIGNGKSITSEWQETEGRTQVVYEAVEARQIRVH
jgi:hypothetical protein